MPTTYPCADTSCTGRTLVNGTPCPDCQKRIDRGKKDAYIEKQTNRLSWWDDKKGKK